MEKSKKWTKEFLEKEKERIKKLRENEPKVEPKHPYELFGIECDKGWEKLYQPIIDYIEDYNKDKEGDDRIEILQIKEKFGYLTIYVSKKTDELRSMIEDAEADSYHTCEVCGKHINKPITEHHWIYPMCRKCFDEMNEKRQKAMEEVARKIKEIKRMNSENSQD
jgi:ribosomal protein L37AE/L43A